MNYERPPSNQPMPEHAKKVFSGVMFDVYQWEQEMYDGSHATFEKITRPDTAQVIPVTSKGTILLTHQEQPRCEPFVCMPSGRLDPGETPLDTAKRELEEEVGGSSSEYILWDARQPTSKIDWAVFTYIARNVEQSGALNLDAGEKIRVEEVTFERFLELVAQNVIRDKGVVMKVLPMLLKEGGKEALRKEIIGS